MTCLEPLSYCSQELVRYACGIRIDNQSSAPMPFGLSVGCSMWGHCLVQVIEGLWLEQLKGDQLETCRMMRQQSHTVSLFVF